MKLFSLSNYNNNFSCLLLKLRCLIFSPIQMFKCLSKNRNSHVRKQNNDRYIQKCESAVEIKSQCCCSKINNYFYLITKHIVFEPIN